MKGLRIENKLANAAKHFLEENNYVDYDFRLFKEKDHIIFPLVDSVKNSDFANASFDYEIIDHEFISKVIKPTFKELVLDILPENLKSKFNRAYDILNDIAIIEIPDELSEYDRQIGDLLRESNHNIISVYKKLGGHEGEFRLQRYELISGVNKKHIEYRENNCIFEFDIEDAYFSVRLSNERKRVFSKIKKGEHVLAMFSGVGPYTCTIGKNTSAHTIIAIEKNPNACKWANINLARNKLTPGHLESTSKQENYSGPFIVKNYCGDVRDLTSTVVKEHGVFDRIIMPLPHTADDFLDCAMQAAKTGTIVHMYDFIDINYIDTVTDKITATCKKHGFNAEIMHIEHCGEFSPTVRRICVDFKLTLLNK